MSRKTGKEAKTERLTWFALILVFMLMRFDRDVSLPDFVIPFIVSAILLISGVYQYMQHWRVSPFTWVFAGVLGISGIFGFYYPSPVDLALVSLIVVIIIIVMGIVTNEG